MTKEQELEGLKRYVEYTLKNIDDFERRIRKEMKKQMENKMIKLTKEQENMTLEARVDFFEGLKGELNKWWVLSDDEQKHMDSLIRAINKYVNYLNK